MQYGYYAEFDTASGYYTVRHTESDASFAQWGSQEEADADAERRNRAGADRHRQLQLQTY